jgi:hypothetical protein
LKISDAIESGKNKYQDARKLEEQKRKLRPLTKHGFLQEFENAYRRCGYGAFPSLDSDSLKKLVGLISNLKKNGFENNQDAHEFVYWLCKNWSTFRQQDFLTKNRKKYTLAFSPNILDVINCREQFLAMYGKEEEKESQSNEEVDLLAIWENQ